MQLLCGRVSSAETEASQLCGSLGRVALASYFLSTLEYRSVCQETRQRDRKIFAENNMVKYIILTYNFAYMARKLIPQILDRQSDYCDKLCLDV